MTKEQKSSCCGAEIQWNTESGEGLKHLECSNCLRCCWRIPSDCWCIKEIQQFCEKWKGMLSIDRVNFIISLDGTSTKRYDNAFLTDIQQLLKSLPIVLGVR